jgi:Uma2 family endonuclease
MSTVVSPITIEEFDKLDLPGDRQWELHDGELVEMPFPSPRHRDIQLQIVLVMKQVFPSAHVAMEYPFVANGSERSGDVAVTTKERARAAQSLRWLEGAPELVVEVLSPSNTALGLAEYQELCFTNGCLIFWTVNDNNRTVEARRKGEPIARTYSSGEQIEISLFGETRSIAVDAIFAEP